MEQTYFIRPCSRRGNGINTIHLLTTTKNLDIIYKTDVRRLKCGQKKAYQLETSGAKKRHGSKFSVFLFVSYIPDLERKKAPWKGIAFKKP